MTAATSKKADVLAEYSLDEHRPIRPAPPLRSALHRLTTLRQPPTPPTMQA